MKIGVIYGGNSNEKEISIKSLENVEKSLKNLGYNYEKFESNDIQLHEKIINKDLILNIVHGEFGEDGKLQGYLDIFDKKYTSSPSETCNICFDKYLFYNIFFEKLNIPKTIKTDKYINPPFDFPLILKPRRGGSSKGIYIIHDQSNYKKYLKINIDTFGDTLIQKYVKGREFTLSIIEKSGEFIILPLLEIIPKNEFYDYNAKYTEGKAKLTINHEVHKNYKKQIENIFFTLREVLYFRDMLRIDFIISEEKIYVLEVNTVPGLTKLSDLPISANAHGINFDKLINIFINNHIK
ncbi:D-alanine--D-alanine ligase family protein [Geotoga petraea]|uniref:ATP-grasp domain-containing protein n=1 Tax=Geotoga petraea TaxID=28234 RepID=A0A4Z0W547_9BACT|nr:ATP-grasp domain-containing protein [Geotoga petraea]MDK2945996.1 D-alanine-D-alanine ligase [Geotoga sp.]TGG88468.1 ATP-grasp domain-containing protein [Geotoga petraea]